LFSALKDKDIKHMLAVIDQFADSITLTSFDDFRFDDLYDYETENVKYIKGFDQAYQMLKESLNPNDMILITGSLHFVGYVKAKYLDAINKF
jgi:dihydrofolate synthase/folylpolyglutamate synthase